MNCSILEEKPYINDVTQNIQIWVAEGEKELGDNRTIFLHGHEATSADKENTAERQLTIQAHPPQQFKHPQHPFLSSIIKWRLPTTWETSHMASKGCIAFLLSLTFTTAPMCKFTKILAEAVKAG